MNTVKKGSRGNDVKTLQAALNSKLGLVLAVDGIFGDKTRAAVRQFQTLNALTVDGICGPKTWAKLGYAEPEYIIPDMEDLKQAASPHGSMTYGPNSSYSTYKNGGCGVVSFAIVQRHYKLQPTGESATQTIQRLGRYSWENGYRPKGAGTNAGLFKTNGTHYTKTTSKAKIEQAVRDGQPVILCINSSFKNGYGGDGHYIVAYGINDEYLLLRDVGSSASSRQKVKRSTLPTGIKAGYIMIKDGE